jgi:hypothetical protein
VKAAKVSQPKGQAEITYDRAKTSPQAIAKRIIDKSRFNTEPLKKAVGAARQRRVIEP